MKFAKVGKEENAVSKSHEYETFDKAVSEILRADPKAVKQAMEAEKDTNAKKRKAKKKSSAVGRAVSGKD
jgi:hypothetical protein